MKRFSFFLAVFSVGLMTFMVLTGQFYKMFGDNEPAGATVPEVPTIETGGNRLVYRNYDFKAGRLRFTVEGVMASSGGLVLSPESLQQQREINDARISIPIYGTASNEASDEILLDSEQVRYEPDRKRAQLSGHIEGVGISGFPRFSTEEVTLLWGGEGGVRMVGERSVRLVYPAIELLGTSGFTAKVVSDIGLGSLEVRPPVLVALSADADGSILGFEGGTPIAEGSDRKSRVLIRSSGMMIVDTRRSSALFEGDVRVHESASDLLLDPSLELPPRHLHADWMEISLDPVSRRLTRLHARRNQRQVTFQLSADYHIEGDDLLWKEGDDRARFTGNVRIVGPVGEFSAEVVDVFPGEDRCVLEGAVVARILGTASRADGPPNDWESRLASDWTLTAARAELVSGDNGRLLRLRATGSSATPVEVVEERPNGARLVGGELLYDPDTHLLEVFRGAQIERPRFTEGPNKVSADRLALSLENPRLDFSGSVEALLVQLPSGPRGSIPRWLDGPPQQEGGTTIACDRLEMTWGSLQRLDRLRAFGGDDPLRLDHAGAQHLYLEGDQLSWNGADGIVTLEGWRHLQRLTVDDRARLSARQLKVQLREGIARGDGEVIAEAFSGPDSSPLKISAEHLELLFNKDVREEAVAAETAPGRGSIEMVRGWGDKDRPLSIEAGNFTGSGQELIWESASDTIRLQGGGEQRIQPTGPDGTDSLTARSLIFERGNGRVFLEGDVRATIQLGNVVDATPRPDRGRQRWLLEADRLVGELSTDPASSGSISLRTLEATGGIRLRQPEGAIEFIGQACQWHEDHQRLRVYSPEGNGLQTLSRGTQRRDEVVARELIMVRSTVAGDPPLERIEVLFIEVLSATLYARIANREAPPGRFELRSDNLLLVLSQQGSGLELIPNEALAWGSTDFKGGEYRVLADRAHFLAGEARMVLTGRDKQPLQVFTAGVADLPPSRSIEVEWTDQGYRLRNRPRGDGWSATAVERALRLMERGDRAPRSR